MKSFFCSLKDHLVRLRSITKKHNLQSAIFNMPKQKKHTAALKQHRQKIKEKTQKYSPGIVTLKVLGSGAVGSPRCLYVFTDQSRYLFNCGEGTQRLAHEHKMRLGKLEHIFFTHGSWENIGGLPGISLTIQDVGVPEITLHGPQGIADIFSATRRFIVLKDLSVKNADYTENPYFEDNVMRISYVPLNATVEHRSRKRSVSWDRSFECNEHVMSVDGEGSSCTDGSTTDDETDYYAHERGGSVLPTVSNKKKKRRRSRSKNRRSTSADGNNDDDVKRRKTEAVGNVAMGYIGKLHARPGALCLDACVERGVPPGPLLGRLKAGEDVTLPNGKVVKSKDVTSPDEPGPVFIVVECPDERFLDSLEKEPQFKRHQSRAPMDDVANLVVHFTPPHIVWNPRYRQWMDKFSSSTQHLMINEANDCMGSIAVHRIQYKLNLLDPEIFPLLSDTGIPIVRESSNSVVANGFKDCDGVNNNDASATVSVSACSSSDNVNGIYQAKTFSVVQLRPNKPLDSSNELILKPDDYEKEIFKEEGMKEALETLHKKLEKCTTKIQKYPSVLFLGTGSCIPNKTRNTSGILLNIEEDHSLLLDCGEGTYGQLVRFHGKENIPKLMSSLKAIYVSHLHADHHIGLIGLLKAKRRYTKISNTLYLLAPKQIMTWLKYYNDHFEPILEQVQLIPNGDLIYDEVTLAKETKEKLYKDVQMSSILTCIVKHCPNAFGIALKHKSGWKLTYSGDTMPTDSLVEIGKESTILIHEATMEDELEHEARVKMHSTTSEAIEIGRKMDADFILLTHFSQRYATLPRFNEQFSKGIGIAFDNMKVRLSDLHKLPLLYPSLKLMFATHQDELELKAHRRLLKQGLTETSKSASRSRSSSPRR